MRSALKFLLILLTITVILFVWVTHQLNRPVIQAIILVLIIISVAGFLILNLLEDRENHARRRARELKEKKKEVADKESIQATTDKKKVRRSDTSFSFRDRKSGLNWGGGNIKASEAKRGTKRKFLGR